MRQVLTAGEALSLLARSSLPTVVTEGIFDYRAMRKIEEKLGDIGVDFFPLGGKDKVLNVWTGLPAHRRANTVAIVDLDAWIFIGIPNMYQGDGLLYTAGYSIENDLMGDSPLLDLLEPAERVAFDAEVAVFSQFQALQVERLIVGGHPCNWPHVGHVIQNPVKENLGPAGKIIDEMTVKYFSHFLRGKSLFELLARQLNRDGRFVKFSYKQLYEIGSSRIGPLLSQLEGDIRHFFQSTRA